MTKKEILLESAFSAFIVCVIIVALYSVVKFVQPVTHLNESFVQVGKASGFITKRVDGFHKYCYIMTCYHVTDNFKTEEGYQPIPITIYDRQSNKKLDKYAVFVEGNKDIDYAILKTNWDFRCENIILGGDISVGDSVVTIGRPNRTFRYGFGKVTSIGQGIGHDAGMFFGSSGGPVFNEHHKLVGINQSVGAYAGQPIGFIGYAVKISDVIKELGPVKTKIYFEVTDE